MHFLLKVSRRKMDFISTAVDFFLQVAHASKSISPNYISELGFSGVTGNSLDATSDRDFVGQSSFVIPFHCISAFCVPVVVIT